MKQAFSPQEAKDQRHSSVEASERKVGLWEVTLCEKTTTGYADITLIRSYLATDDALKAAKHVCKRFKNPRVFSVQCIDYFQDKVSEEMLPESSTETEGR